MDGCNAGGGNCCHPPAIAPSGGRTQVEKSNQRLRELLDGPFAWLHLRLVLAATSPLWPSLAA